MIVEAVSLKRQMECWASEYEAAALRVLRSGWYVLGREVEAFEQSFAEFLGIKHCIGVGNGQDALILAVRALGIGAGDEVIVPSNTYIASVMGITENGGGRQFLLSRMHTLTWMQRKLRLQLRKRQRPFYRCIYMDRLAI